AIENGSFVWVTPVKKHKKKTDYKLLGPFKVVGHPTPVVYEVENLTTKQIQSFPLHRLRIMKGEMNEREAMRLAAQDDQEYVVYRILEHKEDDEGDICFKVHWDGYPEEESTWEYLHNIKDTVAFAQYMEGEEDLKRKLDL
ncbi:hypothetical protein ADUPG1_000958, partial [Aduncisulcus paluster]